MRHPVLPTHLLQQARHYSPKKGTQRGVSLIEILIAVLVLAVGLLGVAALQANALKTNQSAVARSQAAMLAYLILDAMRANRDAAASGAYNLGSLDNPACTAPTASNLATSDQAYWLGKLKENLGDAACGAILCTTASTATTCTVRIRWDDSRAGGSDTQTFDVATRL